VTRRLWRMWAAAWAPRRSWESRSRARRRLPCARDLPVRWDRLPAFSTRSSGRHGRSVVPAIARRPSASRWGRPSDATPSLLDRTRPGHLAAACRRDDERRAQSRLACHRHLLPLSRGSSSTSGSRSPSASPAISRTSGSLRPPFTARATPGWQRNGPRAWPSPSSDVLRMQLHPHFFFNTLNTVSALLEKDPESAREVLAKLGDLLRLSDGGRRSGSDTGARTGHVAALCRHPARPIRRRLSVVVKVDEAQPGFGA